jgi:hypothetical protein
MERRTERRGALCASWPLAAGRPLLTRSVDPSPRAGFQTTTDLESARGFPRASGVWYRSPPPGPVRHGSMDGSRAQFIPWKHRHAVGGQRPRHQVSPAVRRPGGRSAPVTGPAVPAGGGRAAGALCSGPPAAVLQDRRSPVGPWSAQRAGIVAPSPWRCAAVVGSTLWHCILQCRRLRSTVPPAASRLFNAYPPSTR